MSDALEASFRAPFDLCTSSPMAGDLVELAQHSDSKNPIVIAQLREAEDRFYDQLTHLSDSRNPEDQEAVRQMNANFRRFDALYLPPHFDRAGIRADPTEWLLSAGRHKLSALLEWNAERHQKRQHRLLQDIPDLTEQALDGIDRVIGYGLLPRKTRHIAERALKTTTFLAFDSFEAGYRLCLGDYTQGSRTMRLAPPYIGGKDGLETLRPGTDHIFSHETGHAICAESNGGLISILPNTLPPRVTGLWFDEIWPDHWALVARNGQPNVLSPTARNEENGFYRTFRELGEKVMNGLGAPIPFELAGEAYVESMSDNHLTARRALDAALRRACIDTPDLSKGEDNVVDAISRSMLGLSSMQQIEKAAEWITRIDLATP